MNKSKILNDLGFIRDFAINDFKAKYAGSVLGFAWGFIQPVVTILMYWFVFQIGFGSQPVGGVPFILWLSSGIVAWFLISDCISGTVPALVEYKFLVKHIVFNVRILPIVKVIAVMFVQVFLLVFTAVFFALMGYPPTWYYFQLLYYLAYSFFLITGIGYVLSASYVFIRDINQLVTVVLQLVFWFTPIVWNIDTMPQIVKTISAWNPFYFIVRGYRDTFAYGIGFWEYGWMNLFFWALAIVVFFAGRKAFIKFCDLFADVI